MAKRRVYISKKSGLVVDDLPLTIPATDAEKRDFILQEIDYPDEGKEITINGTIYARHPVTDKIATLVAINLDPAVIEMRKKVNISAEAIEP